MKPPPPPRPMPMWMPVGSILLTMALITVSMLASACEPRESQIRPERRITTSYTCNVANDGQWACPSGSPRRTP